MGVLIKKVKETLMKIMMSIPYVKGTYEEMHRMRIQIKEYERRLNYQHQQNLVPQGIMKETVFRTNNKSGNGQSEHYVENAEFHKQYKENKWSVDEELCVSVADNGIILPLIGNPLWPDAGGKGGACDSNGIYVAGHKRSVVNLNNPYLENTEGTYHTDNYEYVAETVVYGGLFYAAYGHMITENLSRLWWYLDNPECKHKLVYISNAESIDNHYKDVFELLGIPSENVILCKKPTRYEKVIIPDQAIYIYSGYNVKAKHLFDKIRDGVRPKDHAKLYFTKSNFHGNDIIGERYFEDFYRRQGYTIVSPESLSIREQVAYMAGAEEFVSVCGTIAHNVLFAQDGIKTTILNKLTVYMIHAQCWINEIKNVNCTYIDVGCNYLPTIGVMVCQLIAPTVYFKQYVQDNEQRFGKFTATSIDEYALEYTKEWGKKTADLAQSPILCSVFEAYKQFTLADIIIGINKYLNSYELDEESISRLYGYFPPQQGKY